jgi:hypothetical protein
MDWQTILEGVRTIVARATGLPDRLGADGLTYVRKVEWVNKTTAARWASGSLVDLELGVVTIEHNDETRYEFVDAPDPEDARLIPTVSGFRVFTVSIRPCVDSQEHDTSAVSAIAGKIRTRLRRQDYTEAMKAAGFSLVDIGPTVNADFEEPQSSRMWSCAILDVTFRCVEWDRADGEDDAGDFINEVHSADAVLVDLDGTEKPVSVDVGPIETLP